MVDQTENPKLKPYAGLFSNRVITVTGEVGCFTLLIVLAALAGGLWIDAQFDTKPLFTVVLMVASVPASMYVIIKIVRNSVIKESREGDREQPLDEEENQSG